MAARKKRTTRPPSATAAGRVAILLEQIQEQNRATIEAVQSGTQAIRREFGEKFDRMTLRLEAVEAAIRSHSNVLQQHSEEIRRLTLRIEVLEATVQRNSEDLQRVKLQLEELTRLVQTRAEASALVELERRVRRLEERLGS